MTVVVPEIPRRPAAPRTSASRREGARRGRRAPLAVGLLVATTASCALWAGLIGAVSLLLH